MIVTLPTQKLLQRDQPYGLRKALAGKIQGITMANVPDITPTRTGWAIVPADLATRDILAEGSKEKTLSTLGAVAAGISEEWFTYFVPRVPVVVYGLEGPVTVDQNMVREEVLAKAGVSPVRAEPARLGVNEMTREQTWIIYFTRRVSPFHIFERYCIARLKAKKMPLKVHTEGCQGWCNPAKCNRARRCNNCGRAESQHVGPMGESCEHPARCANCFGPFKAGHDRCAATPTRKGEGLVKLSAKELKKVREAGIRLTKKARSDAASTASNVQSSPSASSSLPGGSGLASGIQSREDSPSTSSSQLSSYLGKRKGGEVISQYEARGSIPNSSQPTPSAIPETPLGTQAGAPGKRTRGNGLEPGALNKKTLSDKGRGRSTNAFASLLSQGNSDGSVDVDMDNSTSS